ncbi:MAG: CofH family radical SAM protein [Fibrobacterales bacterium]|nr:CofH family radical SAM protein [Fibrobacterales bacterium]MBP5187677.1 CofH family radical SAM protein [Fibrobacterales bacterium]MBP5350987.1 CofH family radical SAM protein [Fibrobacterales bacterium]
MENGSGRLQKLESRVFSGERLGEEEALFLATEVPTPLLVDMADRLRRELNGDRVFYNRNIHFEPTNQCLYDCLFCAFRRDVGTGPEKGGWLLGADDLLRRLEAFPKGTLTELHITGGVHPGRNLEWAESFLRTLRAARPELHLKAFTAVEIDYFARSSRTTVEEALARLKEAGLGSLPGGGAEIFAPEVRRRIAGGKAPAQRWIEVHRAAHRIGLPTNATMLYGHVESAAQRVDHLLRLRDLQEETGGFQAFVPLRYRNGNNRLSALPEISADEERRVFALSRLVLNNVRHLKVYWVMSGMERALGLLRCGGDDLDGTINDSTRIYSMAGGQEHPCCDEKGMRLAIEAAGRVPCERDSLYRVLER